MKDLRITTVIQALISIGIEDTCFLRNLTKGLIWMINHGIA